MLILLAMLTIETLLYVCILTLEEFRPTKSRQALDALETRCIYRLIQTVIAWLIYSQAI